MGRAFFQNRALRSTSARRRSARHRKPVEPTRLNIDLLEDRRLLAVTTNPAVDPVFQDLLSVSVVGESLFYNNSSFDGNNTSTGAADDAAIATDKHALLPGGAASFANYSSYSRGINGLMIDVSGLPTTTLTAADFTFTVGNSNNPGSWSAAPAPTSITVRLGAGVGGSDRVEITWADGAIKNEWLQVTVGATTDTGLAAPFTFYFGNAVGESGNSATDAVVDATDAQVVAANPASITNVYDYNRDGVVNSQDATIATSNATTPATALQLISPPTPPPPTQTLASWNALYDWGDGGFQSITNPALVTMNDGTVLSFAEGRFTNQDYQAYAIIERRSTDGGVTWSPPTAVYQVTPNQGSIIASPAPVVDKTTNTTFLLFDFGSVNPQTQAVQPTNVLVMKSSDDGQTWTSLSGVSGSPTDITNSVKDPSWGWISVGPGHGIQLSAATPHPGRLLVTADHRTTTDNSGVSFSGVIYSDDDGATWHVGGSSTYPYSNESTVVELPNGTLYMSMRINYPNQIINRGYSYSFDGGASWTLQAGQSPVSGFQVEGSSLRLDDNTIVISSPFTYDTGDTERHQMTLWYSQDGFGQTWKSKVVDFNYSGYSDMTLVGPDTLLLAYTDGNTGGELTGGTNSSPQSASQIRLVRVNLKWLEDSTTPYEFDWYFNEGAPGQPADRSGPAVADYGPWNQYGLAFSTTASNVAHYVPGASPGSSALDLTNPADEVILTESSDYALQIGAHDSFTVQLTFKTTATSGVIIGTRPTIANWTLQLVNGKVAFSLTDLTNTALITSNAAINDGQWHQIVAVRDATNHVIKLYVDGAPAATDAPDTTTGSLTGPDGTFGVDPIVLGNYNTKTSHAAIVVDALRFTRAALDPASFMPLPGQFIKPTPAAAPEYQTGGPTMLSGLQFWLPAYQPTQFFGDMGFAVPLSQPPFNGMASRSMLDSSSNAFRITTDSQFKEIQYQSAASIGSYWAFGNSANPALGSELWVQSSNGVFGTHTFDFVQSTGVFTLASFVNIAPPSGLNANMTILDTDQDSTATSGFSLYVDPNGQLHLLVSAASSARFDATAPQSPLVPGRWYFIAVVANGPGNPVLFYEVPVSAAQVSGLDGGTIDGANGTYTTDSFHDLFIGGQSNTSSPGAAPFFGGLANEAIFSTALTSAQIQNLFLYGKGQVPQALWRNPLNPLDVDASGLVSPLDALDVLDAFLAETSATLPPPSAANPLSMYLDTNGDNMLTAIDVLTVVQGLVAGTTSATMAAAPAASSQVTSTISTAPSSQASDAPIVTSQTQSPPVQPMALTFSGQAISTANAPTNPVSSATPAATTPITFARAASSPITSADSESSESGDAPHDGASDSAELSAMDQFFADFDANSLAAAALTESDLEAGRTLKRSGPAAG